MGLLVCIYMMTLAEVKIKNNRAHMHNTYIFANASTYYVFRSEISMYFLEFAHLSAVCVVIMQILFANPISICFFFFISMFICELQENTMCVLFHQFNEFVDTCAVKIKPYSV